MSFKVLYSELQPCVLIACECNPRKPFLLLIRALNQTLTCGFCRAQYAIDVASYSSQRGAARPGQPTGTLKIKRTQPPGLADTGQHSKMN
jgi:hypothetical protein